MCLGKSYKTRHLNYYTYFSRKQDYLQRFILKTKPIVFLDTLVFFCLNLFFVREFLIASLK